MQRDSSNLFSFQPAWTITDLQSTCWETLKWTISGGTRPAAFVWCWSVQCSGSLLQNVQLFLARVVLVAIRCNPRWTEVLTLIVWHFLPCFSYNTAEFCHADSYSVHLIWQHCPVWQSLTFTVQKMLVCCCSVVRIIWERKWSFCSFVPEIILQDVSWS